ncbi:transcriptional regulator [Flavobacterium rivuli WB 3.3-2 = DSM 21788]|uniref:Transcriptional regulator n=1 Tax=Flavobacterium rivuli WB 3.3-2 = DSM 21788 TaxID=1121895 RepID=A0A0A2M4H2_9FLAO|nr:helix-turn-helix transcriptional regulator [Flavobacterium rivuli]KGO86521.1 transcriptional regulator [Flavobacterium rivuli WB 3.3-2 = DSM 21788]
MERIINFDSVHDYNAFNNNETLHPLISIVDLSKADPRSHYKMNFGLFCIILKEIKCGDLKYGNNYYDYQEGTLVFFAPGQVIEVDANGEIYQPVGKALIFHPDFLHGTALGKHMDDYSFFSYNTNEALHLSEKERKIILDCFAKIEYELEQSIDKHSKTLIASNIELFLNYCTRFYDRQFITRDTVHKGVLERFEDLLNGYFTSDRPRTEGLPSVAWCADQLNLSANYFGDLVKKETGKSAQEYIQAKVINIAKERIFNINKSVSEIAYDLGFKYPQHFTRLFKQRVGCTPSEFRKSNEDMIFSSN